MKVTPATRQTAHAVVAIIVAFFLPEGTSLEDRLLAAAGAWLGHALLDAPVAKLMANNGIRL